MFCRILDVRMKEDILIARWMASAAVVVWSSTVLQFRLYELTIS